MSRGFHEWQSLEQREANFHLAVRMFLVPCSPSFRWPQLLIFNYNPSDTVPQQQPLISPSSTSQMLRNVSSSDFQALDHHRINFNFMRKIPPGAEASNILVGEVDFLTKTLSAFIRLNSAAIMGDLTEVPVPTRCETFIMRLSISLILFRHPQIHFCPVGPSGQSIDIPWNRALDGDADEWRSVSRGRVSRTKTRSFVGRCRWVLGCRHGAAARRVGSVD